MSCLSVDLTIDRALADPIVRAAMRADHVDPQGLEDMLRTTARRIDEARLPKPTALAALAGRARDALMRSTPQW